MRQGPTGEVRLDAGRAAHFRATAWASDCFDACCARGAQFTVAKTPEEGDPGPTTTWNLGNVG